MSEVKTYRGVISKVDFSKDAYGELDLEEKCMVILRERGVEKAFDTWQDTFREYFWEEDSYLILGEDIFFIEEKKDVSYESIYLSAPHNGKLKFLVQFHNGGQGFSEALEKAVGSVSN